MTTLQIAHLNKQGQDMIIVPLDDAFGNKTQQDQRRAIVEIQMHARSAGLRGEVVPVWDGEWRSSRRRHGTHTSGASTFGRFSRT
jgi:hypothetical protein